MGNYDYYDSSWDDDYYYTSAKWSNLDEKKSSKKNSDVSNYIAEVKRKFLEDNNEIKFRVGDFIICTDCSGVDQLEKNKIYKIKKSYMSSKEDNGPMVVLEEVKGKAFIAKRFKGLSNDELDDDSQFEDDFEE